MGNHYYGASREGKCGCFCPAGPLRTRGGFLMAQRGALQVLLPLWMLRGRSCLKGARPVLWPVAATCHQALSSWPSCGTTSLRLKR